MKQINSTRGLGWFSLGLGLTEIFLGRTLVRSLGLAVGPWLVRVFGIREIVSGLGVWWRPRLGLSFRLFGDLLDLLTLSTALRGRNRHLVNAVIATLSVAVVTCLDARSAARARSTA